MLFALSNDADTESQSSLRKACFHALQCIADLRDKFVSSPFDPFKLDDRVDPATRFGSYVFAAQAMAKAGMVPGPDAEAFLEMLRNPGENRGIVAFFARSQDDRSRESRIRDVAAVVLPVLASLPGCEDIQKIDGKVTASALRDAFPLLRELAFEMRKPATLLEAADDDCAVSQKLYARFQASCLSGANLEAIESLLVPGKTASEIEPSPDFEL